MCKGPMLTDDLDEGAFQKHKYLTVFHERQ